MLCRLLLVDGNGEARAASLSVLTLREFPGPSGLSVHFRPVRNDLLFESAKEGGRLAYRILIGEGIVRSQLIVEYEVAGERLSVMGRSGDLLFALALLTAKWSHSSQRYTAVAATGVLDAEGGVQSVGSVPEKITAAVRDLESTPRAVVFYPAVDAPAVEQCRTTTAIPPHVELVPVMHLDDALRHLGYALEKVYLRNPFRGLENFEYQHHAIFFGRDREVREVVEQLVRREAAGMPGLLVEGASGSGKSSFLQAGLLPALLAGRFGGIRNSHGTRAGPPQALAGLDAIRLDRRPVRRAISSRSAGFLDRRVRTVPGVAAARRGVDPGVGARGRAAGAQAPRGAAPGVWSQRGTVLPGDARGHGGAACGLEA